MSDQIHVDASFGADIKAKSHGLIVGLRSSPTCLLKLIPTPPSSKGDAFNLEWSSEHAFQVSRMLIGGVSVVGAYFCGCEPHPQLLHSIHTRNAQLSSVAPKLPLSSSDSQAPNQQLQHQLQQRYFVLHQPDAAAVSSRVFFAFDSSSLSTSPSPPPLKLSAGVRCAAQSKADLIASFRYFSLNWRLSFEIPFRPVSATSRATIQQRILQHLRLSSTSLWNSLAVFESKQNAQLILPPHSSGSEGVGATLVSSLEFDGQRDSFRVELFSADCSSPPSADSSSSSSVEGVFRVSGTLSSRAVALPSENLSLVTRRLKADAVQSLFMRVESLAEHDDSSPSSSSSSSSSSSASSEDSSPFESTSLREAKWSGEEKRWTLPRRLFVSRPPAVFCDYFSASETSKDSAERCTELLSHGPSSASSFDNFFIVTESYFRSTTAVTEHSSSPSRASSSSSSSSSTPSSSAESKKAAAESALRSYRPPPSAGLPFKTKVYLVFAVLVAIAALYAQYQLVLIYRAEP